MHGSWVSALQNCATALAYHTLTYIDLVHAGLTQNLSLYSI